jgi:hypothetical protein
VLAGAALDAAAPDDAALVEPLDELDPHALNATAATAAQVAPTTFVLYLTSLLLRSVI